MFILLRIQTDTENVTGEETATKPETETEAKGTETGKDADVDMDASNDVKEAEVKVALETTTPVEEAGANPATTEESAPVEEPKAVAETPTDKPEAGEDDWCDDCL